MQVDVCSGLAANECQNVIGGGGAMWGERVGMYVYLYFYVHVLCVCESVCESACVQVSAGM